MPLDCGEDYPNHGKHDDRDGDDADRHACDSQALTILLDGFIAIHGLIVVIVLTVAGRLIPGGSVHVVLAVGGSARIIVGFAVILGWDVGIVFWSVRLVRNVRIVILRGFGLVPIIL